MFKIEGCIRTFVLRVFTTTNRGAWCGWKLTKRYLKSLEHPSIPNKINLDFSKNEDLRGFASSVDICKKIKIKSFNTYKKFILDKRPQPG